MRAAIYARVSGEDRGSLQTQLEMGRGYAAQRGYTVVGEYSEEWVSGAALDAPELQRVIKAAQAGGVDVLIVREMDRLARDLVKQMLVEEQLRKAGARIEYVLGEYPDTPEGTLNKQIRAVVAEFERQKITERSSRGKRASALAGNVLGGRAPYGYRFTDDHLHLEIVESEAEIVRLIYAWYIGSSGAPLASSQIAARLTEMQVPTWADLHGIITKRRREYAEWGQKRVIDIIKNETYAGTFYYGRENRSSRGYIRNPQDNWIAVDVPAIVDHDTWAAAQVQLHRNKTLPVHAAQHEYLLQGHLTCGECGSSVYSLTDSHNAPHYWRYYRCGSKVKNGAHTCTLPGVRVEDIDAAAWEWITALLLEPEHLAAGLEALRANPLGDNPLERQLADLQARAVALRARLERLLDLYISGHLEKEPYLQRQTALAAELTAVENERRALETARTHAAPPTADELQNAAAFAQAIAAELSDVEFPTRRSIVSALDVRGTLFDCRMDVSVGLPRAWRYDIFIRKISYIPTQNRIRLYTTLETKRPR